MGIRAKARKAKRPTPSRDEQRARETRATLERAVRQQRTIRRLTGELQRAIVAADDGLRSVGRIAIERDEATAYRAVHESEHEEPATVGAALDPRD